MKPILLSLSARAQKITAICVAGATISIMMLCPPLPVRGQSRTFLGGELRIHDVNHSGGFAVLNANTLDLPLFADGKGFGQSLGIKLQHRLSSTFGLSGTLAWNRLPGSFEAGVRNPSGELFAVQLTSNPPPGDSIPDYDRLFTLTTDVAYSTLSLELLGEWRPIGKEGEWSLGVAAGPTLSRTFSATMRQKAHLEEPQNMRFVNSGTLPTEDNRRTIIIYDGDVPEPEPLRAGVRGGLFAEFTTSASGVIVSPALFYDMGITQVSKAENWHLTMLTGQISVMIRL